MKGETKYQRAVLKHLDADFVLWSLRFIAGVLCVRFFVDEVAQQRVFVFLCVFSLYAVSNLSAVAPYLLSPCDSPDQAAASFTFDPATE